jgi:hypothetical protein
VQGAQRPRPLQSAHGLTSAPQVTQRVLDVLAAARLFRDNLLLSEARASQIVTGSSALATPDPAQRRLHLESLAQAAKTAGAKVSLEALVTDEDGHSARLMVDPIRSALRRLGVPLAWPGTRLLDRDGKRTVRFQYWGEEALEAELSAAGLRVAARRGPAFDLAPTDASPPAHASHASSRFWEDVVMALSYMPRAQALMRHTSPEVVFAEARRVGARARVRETQNELRTLRRAISWADYLFPREPNPAGSPESRATAGGGCFRRTVLELCMDGGSAKKIVHMGIDIGKTGHAWVEGDTRAPQLDVVFSFPPNKPWQAQ